MNRQFIHSLICWKLSQTRKPLVLRGARQVGKTWILNEFGRLQFRKTHYVNFQRNPQMGGLFQGSLETQTLLQSLEFLLGERIDTAEDLLILDEIQDCPPAITALKYFQEDMPQLAVAAAGSLLGVTHPHSAFPVGKVEFLDLYPMSFSEFLNAQGLSRELDFLQSVAPGTTIPEPIHDKMMAHFREYLAVGGMPEVVAQYTASDESQATRMAKARLTQSQLLDAYSGDFAKYAGRVASSHIVSTFRSIPAQLARESKNFKPSITLPGSRFSQLRGAVEWLSGAGLLIKVPIIHHVEIPLVSQVQENRFKPYFLDIGLLGALAEIPPHALMLGDDLFTTFKGSLCENAVAQALIGSGFKNLYCWEGLQSEVEFLAQAPTGIYPIEVKSGLSGKLKSLNVYFDKYAPPMRTRISARNLQVRPEDNFANLPLWLAERFGELISA
jgi:uncharacterized protein